MVAELSKLHEVQKRASKICGRKEIGLLSLSYAGLFCTLRLITADPKMSTWAGSLERWEAPINWKIYVVLLENLGDAPGLELSHLGNLNRQN